MKKYFMKETSEEVKLGDIISLNLSKELKNGTTHHKVIDCKVTPESLAMLIDEDVIDEIEVKESSDSNNEEIQNKTLNNIFTHINDMINSFSKNIDSITSELTQFSNLMKVNKQ